ncbi:hypothetical protein J4N45_11185 [Vibrio sp. SCSIO 43140]|uniref:hypothetical protein n=1 Tax=Vibrio sp. SCSIO 43140 TaxID=2819100 RepID=UPI002075C6DB|nr:hypothetical protein [Vibrio sp. SCSIO 43140]USD59095.1 hypothetical protein J4N45_11185 [Vibrio sp. SCSIO 43140]
MKIPLVSRSTLIVTVSAVLFGCNDNLIENIVTEHTPPAPTVFYMNHGQEVDIGGEVTQIVGTDFCDNGLGEVFACWQFSLTEGDKQAVLLGNGTYELWTTVLNDANSYSLKRPNGVIVSAIVGDEGCDIDSASGSLMATLLPKSQAQSCPLN